jgi:3'-phosphoadenosine 5'-phosphosulfate sulfotransferase (PAPS reductase)/FAD synthetase
MKELISTKELNARIGWTLEQKIDHALYIIDAFNAKHPKSTISFSGGLDSTVMLHLIRIVDKNKKGIFVNTTNEHSEIVKFVKEQDNVDIIMPKITFTKIVEQHGFPLISKKVAGMIEAYRDPLRINEASKRLFLTGKTKDGHNSRTFIIPEKWLYLLKAPFDVTAKCCYYLKKKPLRPYKKDGTFVGTKATDSRLRMISYQKIGCINEKINVCTPLSIWTREDVVKFIKQNNIPYSSIYDNGEVSTGCAYCGFGMQFDITRFRRLKEREPKRYEIMMNIKNNGIPYKDAIQMVFKRTCHLQPTFFDI